MRHHRRLALVAALLLAAARALAAPGDLDPSFGTGGLVTTPIGSLSNPSSLGILPDGRIVVAGSATVAGVQVVALARYLSSGALDAAFGAGGIVTAPLGPGPFASALALQSDGRIVVAGGTFPPVSGLVARFAADGSLDASFGTAGVTVLPDRGFAEAVVIQGDGKIVVAALDPLSLVDPILRVYRLLPDGSFDPDFTTFVQHTRNGYELELQLGLALLSGGRIAVAGEYRLSLSGFDNYWALTRILPDGTPDDSFGPDGVAVGPLATHDGVGGSRVVLVAAAGKLVAGGMWNHQPGAVRFDEDGTVDATFGNAGGTVVAIDGDARTGVLQVDGRIVLAGYGSLENAFQLVRLSDDGSLDTSFGSGGIVETAWFGTGFGATSIVRAVAVQADGKIVAAGPAGPSHSDHGFALARYIGVDACTAGLSFAPTRASTLRLKHAGVDPVPGDDALALDGQVALPSGLTFADLDLMHDGARVLLTTSTGAVVVDATLPAGPYGGRGSRGWTMKAARQSTYRDRTGAPLGGIVRLRVTRRDPTGSRVAVAVRGKDGTYPALPADVPVHATVVFGGASASLAGRCVETGFAAGDCTFGQGQTQLVCRR